MHFPKESVGLHLVAPLPGKTQYCACGPSPAWELWGMVGSLKFGVSRAPLNLRLRLSGFLLPALQSTKALSTLVPSHQRPGLALLENSHGDGWEF